MAMNVSAPECQVTQTTKKSPGYTSDYLTQGENKKKGFRIFFFSLHEVIPKLLILVLEATLHPHRTVDASNVTHLSDVRFELGQMTIGHFGVAQPHPSGLR